MDAVVLAIVGLAFLVGGKLDLLIEHFIEHKHVYKVTAMIAQWVGFVMLLIALGLIF